MRKMLYIYTDFFKFKLIYFNWRLITLQYWFCHTSSVHVSICFILFQTEQFLFQFSSVTQLCLTLCDPMNHSMPGLPVHHQHPKFTQTHVHRVSDAIQPSHPMSPSSLPQSLPASKSFPVSQLFSWGGQSTGVSALASFLSNNTQDWSLQMYLKSYICMTTNSTRCG